MKDLSIIIPVHEFNEEIKNLLNKSIQSVIDMENNNDTNIIVVGPETILNQCKDTLTITDTININYLVNEKSDFCSQVNLAANECNTKYFSVLEFDDTYKKKWLTNVELYLKSFSDVSVLLPINELCDTEGKVLSFINEVAWASSFSTELGFLDLDCLTVYMDFNVTGGIIKTEDFIDLGGLKPSLKITSWYEFLMRLCHNAKKVMIVPKVGYSHMINRKGSLMEISQKEITRDEGEWLIKTAQQEYFYKEDRNKQFIQK